MSHARETTPTLFIMYLSPLISGCPRVTVWLTIFQSCMLPLFFSGLLSYMVGMKRTTSRCVTCKRDNFHLVRYVLISPDFRGLPLVNRFTKLYITFILNRIAFIFGRDEDEDQ